MEVGFTGMSSLRSKNLRLTSTTSLWMFFIYGLVVVLEPFFIFLAPVNIFVRGFVYASFIFLGEFVTGMALKGVNICPWDYSHSPLSIKGVIRLDYMPAWMLAGLIFEQVYWMLIAI